MRKICRDLFTGIDGTTFDILRVGCALGLVSYIGLSTYAIFTGDDFNWIGFGTGFAAILAASGAGIGLKKDTEPKPCP